MALSKSPAGQLITVPAGLTFHPFTLVPNELQLHIFSFVLDWLIAESQGRSPYQRRNYTNIRQLLYEGGVNPLLRTNKLVRSLTLTAWRLELLRWSGEKTQRDERRREKALCFVELLGNEELHLDGMRLLLTSNAKWERTKVQLHHLLHAANSESDNTSTPEFSLFNRLSATSCEIEIWIITYATPICLPNQCTCIGNHNRQPCDLLKLSAAYHCPSLLDSNPLQVYNCFHYRSCSCPRWRRCRTAEEFEKFWELKREDARRRDGEGGDRSARSTLSRERVVVEFKWRKEGWCYRGLAEEVRKVAEAYLQVQLQRWKSTSEAAVERRHE